MKPIYSAWFALILFVISAVAQAEVVIDGLQNATLTAPTTGELVLRNCKNVTVTGYNGIDPTPDTPLITVEGSEWVRIERSNLTGGGIRVVDSPFTQVVYCSIDLMHPGGTVNRREGIMFEGVSYGVIDGNSILGSREDRNRSDDLIQIQPSPSAERRAYQDPFNWPNRAEWNFKPYDGPAASETFRVFHKAPLVGEHAGKVMTYATEVGDWPVGNRITNNNLHNAGIAGVFVLRCRKTTIQGNTVSNSIDSWFSVEWAEETWVEGNTCWQTPGLKGGGIGFLHYGLNNVAINNITSGPRIVIRGWGFPQIGTQIIGNKAGGILVYYTTGGDFPWHDGYLIQGNIVDRRIEVGNPVVVYSTGDIIGNTLLADRSDAVGISVESFRGTITDNTILGRDRGGRFALRDFNVGGRLTSEVQSAGNRIGGEEKGIVVYDLEKPPITAPTLDPK